MSYCPTFPRIVEEVRDVLIRSRRAFEWLGPIVNEEVIEIAEHIQSVCTRTRSLDTYNTDIKIDTLHADDYWLYRGDSFDEDRDGNMAISNYPWFFTTEYNNAVMSYSEHGRTTRQFCLSKESIPVYYIPSVNGVKHSVGPFILLLNLLRDAMGAVPIDAAIVLAEWELRNATRISFPIDLVTQILSRGYNPDKVQGIFWEGGEEQENASYCTTSEVCILCPRSVLSHCREWMPEDEAAMRESMPVDLCPASPLVESEWSEWSNDGWS
jgi:hypothetical protein